ncbi:hypothetical protein HMPREF9446_01133 [Bacteroides fluxus YIT 12057]|uniref:Uncharacterized protein n=1 Tax=Bacteroides fluxus YIT 12057 TaxID=763034 RepID=F3PQY5_9BACE|nr:hypothetical protein HMPREF9446_01133 [Bacteroides fluxus YIT 12057]
MVSGNYMPILSVPSLQGWCISFAKFFSGSTLNDNVLTMEGNRIDCRF